MGMTVRIVDGTGKDYGAKVAADGSIIVSLSDPILPPRKSPNRLHFLSQYVSTDGFGGGVTNMNVDGSVTPQEFHLMPSLDYDIRVMKIVISIIDNTVSHDTFGALPALTNGVDVFITESGITTFILEKVKTFADLIRSTAAERPFGADATSFELSNVTGTQDAQVLPFDFSSLIPGGLRIGRGNADHLAVMINDNLTGLTEFTIRCLGYKHFPDEGE